jgi:hypothetical protein
VVELSDRPNTGDYTVDVPATSTAGRLHPLHPEVNDPLPGVIPLSPFASWSSADGDHTESVAWGDVDGDGDLDLAAGNGNVENKVYLNQGGMLLTPAAWTSPDNDYTTSVAWGDVDGDGDLDLAAGNWPGTTKIYLNEGGMLVTDTAQIWNSQDSGVVTLSLDWGDANGDGWTGETRTGMGISTWPPGHNAALTCT